MFGKLGKKAQSAGMKMAVRRLLKTMNADQNELPMICIMEDRKGSLSFNMVVSKVEDGRLIINRTVESFDLENMDLASVMAGDIDSE